MKVLIIGAGTVGLATGRGFERFGHVVYYADTNAAALEGIDENRRVGPDDMLGELDVMFVCVPEAQVENVVHTLVERSGGGMVPRIVIRSTVAPGTTDGLAHLARVIHNPEFLRGAVAEDDFLHERYTILGVPYGEAPGAFSGLIVAYNAMGRKVVMCSSTESELAKLLQNNHLAMLISFWNEAAAIAESVGVNSHVVARLTTLDSRVSTYGAYKHGAPYTGGCLPKDLRQTLDFARERGVETPLLVAVAKVNAHMGGE